MKRAILSPLFLLLLVGCGSGSTSYPVAATPAPPVDPTYVVVSAEIGEGWERPLDPNYDYWVDVTLRDSAGALVFVENCDAGVKLGDRLDATEKSGKTTFTHNGTFVGYIIEWDRYEGEEPEPGEGGAQ